MFGRARSSIRWLGIVLVAICAADAAAQVPGSNVKVITLQSTTAPGELYVGILGEIAKPGVYRLDSQSLTLQSVIRRAGGLTDDGTGTIRIVRQDRVVENVFFSPQTNTPLMAGDLLVVESRRAQSAISKMYESDPNLRAVYARAAAAAVKGADPSGVQVAFVNVLDRPVVVKVKHEDARLSNVIQMLDQPQELAESVRVIGPDRLLLQGSTAHPIQAPLADGSVIVFPRNAINRRKLPALPAAFDSEIASGAIPSLIGGSSGQSTELRNVGQLPPRIAREPINSPPASLEQATVPPPSTIQNVVPPPTDRLEIPAPAPQSPLVSSRPPIATLPTFKGESRITSSSQITRGADSEPASEPPALDQKSGTPKPADKRDETPATETNLVSHHDGGKKAPITLTQMVSILACMGMLMGLALFTRFYLERKATRPGLAVQMAQSIAHEVIASASPADSVVKSIDQNPSHVSAEIAPATLWFDQLLGNRLTIREEPLELPEKIALQGRVIPPPVFRVDSAVASPLSQGPHFAISQPTEAVENASPAETEIIDEFDAAHETRPSRPHFMRRRPGENTVAAAAVAATHSSIPPATVEFRPSSTPVTDALRHLQGGQP